MAGDVNFVTGFGRTLKGSRSPIKQKQGIKVYDQERSRAKFATKKGGHAPVETLSRRFGRSVDEAADGLNAGGCGTKGETQ